MGTSALVVGSTGLIGKQLTQNLLQHTAYSKVVCVTRSPQDFGDPRYVNRVINFDQIDAFADEIKANHVFCCLGTTMKKAGSKEKFRKVDYHYPLEIAKTAKQNGAKSFLLVSSMGADTGSSFFYNQVKGEVEEAIGLLNFESYHIFRPSLLMGPRNEKRTGERFAQVLMSGLSFLFVGPIKKYKPIQSDKVANAMVNIALKETTGKHIYESDLLQQF